MRAFFAALYKDIKLFLSGAGLLALLLPLLLLPALRLGMEDLNSTQYLQSFPIAVRDEDGTVMSRSLITQLESVELFSEVRVLDGNTTDRDALADGAAAVATIPKDFFYEVYRMADCPLDVTLNSDMPTESAVLEAIFRSVMGIIRSNHASALGTYTFVYGDLTDDLVRQMRRETGDRLVTDALGRQRVFESMYGTADIAGALLQRLAACVLGILAIFFAICTAKTVPEELGLGVLPRFHALGLGTGGFAASKYVSALALSLPALLLVSALTEISFWPVLALYALLLLAAFGVCLFICALTPDPASAQRWANLLLLVSLAFGGTLWPVNGLPEPLRALRYVSLPYYAHMGMECLRVGAGLGNICRLLWPAGVAAFFSPAVAVPLCGRRRVGLERGLKGVGHPATSPLRPPESAAALPLFRRIWNISALRLRHITGSAVWFAAALAVAALCGVSASSINRNKAEVLHLAAVDLDRSELSGALIGQIASAQGVSLELIDPEDADIALITGDVEGVLTVGEGYGEAVSSMSDTPLDFKSSSSSLTSQGAREIVAGAVLIQIRAASSIADAEHLLGRSLTAPEVSELRETITECEKSLHRLYNIAYSSGSAPADPFAPTSLSFAILICLFTLLTAASFHSSQGAKNARRRLRAMEKGKILAAVPDLASLTAAGALTVFAVLAPSGISLGDVLPALAAALSMASLSLLLTRFSAAGRVDALAPILALLICLIGGCFLNIASLSPALARLTLVSPAGLAAAAAASVPCFLALLAESAVFTALSAKK